MSIMLWSMATGTGPAPASQICISGISYLQGGVNDTKTKQIYMILIAVDLKTGKYTTIPQMAVMPVMILQRTFVD